MDFIKVTTNDSLSKGLERIVGLIGQTIVFEEVDRAMHGSKRCSGDRKISGKGK